MATSSPKLFMTAGLREVGRTGVGPSAPSIPGKPARLRFNNYGGWILGQRDLNSKYAALAFAYALLISWGISWRCAWPPPPMTHFRASN